jgi:short-subunit dehydrogenase
VIVVSIIFGMNQRKEKNSVPFKIPELNHPKQNAIFPSVVSKQKSAKKTTDYRRIARILWIFAGLLLLPSLLTYLFAITFTVHTEGIVVITGASSGIGEQAAKTLVATTNFQVYAGVRKEKDAKRLKATYPGINTVVIDVTSQESINTAVELIQAKITSELPFVGLVNNAGVQADLPIELQSSKADRYNFNVNVFGLLDTTRSFLPLLRSTGNGARIVNVGSLAGVVASPGSASYSASKYAVEGITDSLRKEVQSMGISVSILQPGYVQSKMGEKLHDNTKKGDESEMYGVSPKNYELYKHVFEGFFAEDKTLAQHENASPAETTTTAAIIHALTSSRPKTRYPVANAGPFPAWLIITLASILPDRVFDLLQ